jgi:nitroimidazol reductase NimA-like FMN-containing flavoprotein (pyridoxamine 5'-phosphate oxidase superfamily)
MGRPHEFLAEQRVLRLATVSDDGLPHVVPVWYMYREGAVYVGTNTRTTKAKNVARTKRVAFCVDEGIRSPLYGVMGRGRARLITKDIGGMARDILLRYFDSMDDESAAELYRDTDCIIEIIPDHITEWS